MGLAVIVILSGFITLLLFEAYYARRIIPGVYVWGVDLGGLRKEEATRRLETHFQYPQSRHPDLVYGDSSWHVDPAQAGVTLDAEATVDAALAYGKGPDPVGALGARLRAMLRGQAIEPRFRIDPALVADFLDRVASDVEEPAVDADLRVEPDLQVTVYPAQEGLLLDRDAARQALIDRLVSMRGGQVFLPVHRVNPAIADLSHLKARAERVLSSSLFLQVPDQPDQGPWELSQAALASMLVLDHSATASGQPTVTVSLDPGALEHYVEGIAPQVNRPPQDVVFRWDPEAGGLSIMAKEIYGQVVDVGRTVNLLQTHATSSTREVPLALQPIRPALTEEDLPGLGITQHIAQGRTSFAGSPAGRVTNITIAASKFDGVLIAPGETFSFNHYLGDVSAEEGYEESYIIFGDRTTVGLGGGVCQVSTTAFRAAFWAGLPIAERWAHGYRVSWYEPPVGLDATIYSPSVDLKFVNDTGQWILIQTHVDQQQGTLTFDFFGASHGRTVTMEGPHSGEPIPHGEPVYRDDPTLPKGIVKQIEWAKEGLDVSVDRIVHEDGIEVRRDSFVSHYRPWQAVFLVGTKE